ncbi:unnamed protein product [Orchesella dallaii]|uniref:Elongator complex protein 5 n=1 Tax=Orchesella dallaii TaxID=48710 RepID=A0ABP1PQC3_9HEXA
MPEGIQYALSSKLSSDESRVSVIVYETGPSLFVEYYIQEALTNCLESLDGSNSHVHLLLFAHDSSTFQFSQNDSSVTVYDFVRDSANVVLENVFEDLMNNVSSKPGRTHIMFMDDYSIFSILSTSRDIKRQSRFLNLVKKRFRKMFLFFHKDTLTSQEIGIVYDVASDICYLQSHPGAVGSSCNSSSKFLCDLLKIRPNRRVTHEKTIFQITNEEIVEESLCSSMDKDPKSSSDVLKNLTTFKLTLEDGERESKNSLHLPYFEAQKISLDNPDNFDDFEDDEEDEEV